jgi:hypothetical protein
MLLNSVDAERGTEQAADRAEFEHVDLVGPGTERPPPGGMGLDERLGHEEVSGGRRARASVHPDDPVAELLDRLGVLGGEVFGRESDGDGVACREGWELLGPALVFDGKARERATVRLLQPVAHGRALWRSSGKQSRMLNGG